MKILPVIASLAMINAAPFTVPAWAQGGPQTVSIEHVDVETLAAGYRSSKIVSSPLVNGAHGKIEHLRRLSSVRVTGNHTKPEVFQYMRRIICR